MKTDNTMPRYTAQEIADDFFTDGVLWDVWGHSSCTLAEFCRHNIDGCECGLDYEVCDGVVCPDYEVCDTDFN